MFVVKNKITGKYRNNYREVENINEARIYRSRSGALNSVGWSVLFDEKKVLPSGRWVFSKKKLADNLEIIPVNVELQNRK